MQQDAAPVEQVAPVEAAPVEAAAPPAEAAPPAGPVLAAPMVVAPPVAPRSPPPTSGFKFIGLAQSRAVVSSVATTNPYLDGQVLGRLGGTNGTEVSTEEKAAYVEQRLGGFFNFTPPILDGKAALDAAFEVDFLWGDQSYGAAGNTGGAFGGDQVNLQTRRLFTTYKPSLPAGHKLSVVAGLQLVTDAGVDPSASRADDLFRTGGRFMFWGSEAAGLTVYGRYKAEQWDKLRYRLGAYTLYEDGASLPDDIALFMADAAVHPAYATWVGLHGWVVRDRAGGGGGGVLGSGVLSPLATLQGAGTVDAGEGASVVDADIAWLAADLAWNHDLSRGPVGVTALGLANVGRVYVEELADVPVLGFAGDVEARWQYAPGAGSVARVEGLFTTGDRPDDGSYDGVLTANTWGVVGAVHASHGALLLFSDPLAINRQVAVVSDVSAAGAGLIGLTGTVGYDLVPSRVTAQLGGGHARTLQPSDTYGEAGPVGTELNARLRTKPWLFANLDLCGAAVFGTDQAATPWMAMMYFDWVVF